MKQEIPIGVAGESFRVVDFQAADDQRYSWMESVRVKTEADAHGHE